MDHVFGWEEFGGIAEGLEDGLEFFYFMVLEMVCVCLSLFSIMIPSSLALMLCSRTLS